MNPGWTLLIALHAGGATVAVMLGAYLVVRHRKGDLLHRRLGRFWMADMYWVAFSSFGIKRLTPGHFSWIHVLSAWTILSLTMAIWAARTHRIQAHRGWVVGTYLGLVGAGLAAVAFPVRLLPQTAVHHPIWLLAGLLVAAVITFAAIGLSRRGRPRGAGRIAGTPRPSLAQPVPARASRTMQARAPQNARGLRKPRQSCPR